MICTIMNLHQTPEMGGCMYLRSGNRGHSLKLFTKRAKINLRKMHSLLEWLNHSLSNCVIQARSINSFKNRLNKLWSTQAIIYQYEFPLRITTGTGNYDIKIFDSEEDLIMEEPSGSCDQKQHKVS